jgi:hypothetical protein
MVKIVCYLVGATVTITINEDVVTVVIEPP